MNDQSRHELPAQALARSAFGFTLVAWLSVLIAWVMILIAQRPASPLFQQIHTLIVIAFGLLALLLLGACVWTYRTPTERLLPVSSFIVVIFSRPVVAWLTAFLLLEINLFAFQALYNVAPAITNATKFLLICWSLLAVGILIAINRASLRRSYQHTSPIWISLGLIVAAFALLALLQVVNRTIVNATGIDNRLRGGLDYRALTFFEDGTTPPSSAEFWQEQARTRVRWSPYTYWVMDAFTGRFINIDTTGMRFTPDPAPASSPTIHVYGGSTVWGEGARDAYTIPGHLARLLAEQGTPRHVSNYGQTGFVSTQDLIWFQLQLSSGNAPDLAIFYQGFNDILSAWGSGKTGITLQEEMRMNDSEAGRILRAGQPLLALPAIPLSTLDLSAAAVTDTSAQAILDRWLANRRLIESMAQAYDVQVLFVWQPAIIYKHPLTASEQAITQRWESERPGLFDLYRQVDQLLRSDLQQDDNLLLLGDLFAQDDSDIFHDLVHITEQGNFSVAQAILAHLNQMQPAN